jgi:tRNA(adenine34) deaminase
MKLENSMKIAIEEARESLREGNHGFGAVIVRDNSIIARAHDTEETETDPTAHAEMNAIRKASTLVGKDLSTCILISTHEPCPMCATAIVWAQIQTVAFGYAISDAVAQGRRRIELSCEELFQKADAKVAIQRGVLKDECSILYDRAVRAELKGLRSASDDYLRECDMGRAAKRVSWYQAQNQKITAPDALERAYRTLLLKIDIQEEQAPVVDKNERKIVFHSKNFCPTLEACKILGLDTRRICKLYSEKSTDALVKQVDSRLSFSRNYERIRPYSEYCEELIEYHDEA